MIVAIDGPAGSGKSTTARVVADRLGFLYLDTGAMYRAVALAFLRAGCRVSAEDASTLVPGLRLDVRHEADGMHILLDGEDVTTAIRQPEIGEMASHVSMLAAVREKLVAEQRRIGREYAPSGVVLDGRDIGTVVFPDADLKVFMIADDTVRARRRVEDLRERGIRVPFEEVLHEIRERDRRDSARALAPLRQADDAVVLDTTGLSIDDQVQFVIDRIRERSTGFPVENVSLTDGRS